MERANRWWKLLALGLALSLSFMVVLAAALVFTRDLREQSPAITQATVTPATRAFPASSRTSGPAYQPYVLGEKQAPIVTVPSQPVRNVRERLGEAERVIGVVVGGQSRAYPLNMLTGPTREIFNDVLGGQPIAVTWCPRCHSAVVYDRIVDGRTLRFGVAGLLWSENMIMYDQETGTRWSQLLGEGQAGELEGKTLRQIPSVLADWSSWRDEHPDGTVVLMQPTSTEFRHDFYRDATEFVVGVADGDKATAWTFDALERSQFVDAQWNGKPVLVAFDKQTLTARLFERTLNDRVLSFKIVEDRLTDRETGTVWNPATGQGTAGALAGRSLAPIPAVIAYRKAWLEFHPRSAVD